MLDAALLAAVAPLCSLQLPQLHYKFWSVDPAMLCRCTDGPLLDAALLAAVAALRSLQLPQVAVNDESAVVPEAAADMQPESR